MKKSLIALLVVLALVVTVSVFTVSAEKTTAEILAADYSLETGVCPHCDKLWSELNPVAYTGQTATGHYYLSGDLTKTISTVSNTELVIHLNSHTLSGGGNRLLTHYTNASVYFVDAKDNGGTLTGATAANTSSTGGVLRVDGGNNNKLYLYNVNVIGAPSWKQGGAIWLNGTSQFYMYGGTVSGGSAVDRGGNICMTTNAKATIAGTVSGGSVTGGIYSGGNIYVETGCTLTLEEGATISDGYCTATGNFGGGNIGLRGTGSLVMNGGTVSGGSAVKGGNIFIGGSGSITLNGGFIKDGFSHGTQIGGNICVEDTAKLYIKGATIQNGYTTNVAVRADAITGRPVNGTSTSGAGRGGNIAMRGTSTLEMTSGTVSGGNAPTGGNFVFEGAGTDRVISGGEVTGGYAKNGGNLYLNTIGTSATKVTVSGTALITAGTATGNGGNACLAGAEGVVHELVLAGGTISGGQATTSGGVCLNTNAIFTMTGGLLTANTSTNGGGNIRPAGDTTTVNISGGTISNGVVTSGNGGNLFCNHAAVINITGGTFSGGTATAEGANICLTNAATTSVMKNATISGGTSSGTGKSIGATLCMMTGNFAEISGMTFVGGTTAAAASTSGGGVYIASGSYTIKNSTFTGGNAYANGGALLLSTSGTTTLENCTVSGGIARYGANVCMTNGTLNLVNTDINKCGSGTIIYGGGLYVTAGTVNMDQDSTIVGSTAMHGGNVYVNGATAAFNLNGGTISGGTAYRDNATETPYGGNVAVTAGKFTMNSGTISGGKLVNSKGNTHGGNVYVGGGEFELVNGTISGGSAKTAGGNVCVKGTETAAAVFTMQNGEISGGTCNNNQAGVFVGDYATFTMNNGLIDNNDSVYSGANVGVKGTSAVLDINGGTISNGDSTSGAAGNLLISTGATATIDNATISGGTAAGGGGNIQFEGGTAAFTNCTIENGASVGMGGNAYLHVAGATFTNCTITGGVAGTKATDAETGELITPSTNNGRGGNLAINANATLTGCTISGGESYGSANPGGGNVYIVGGDNNIIDGCTITDGFAFGAGGNIQLHGTPVVTIKGNSNIQGGVAHKNWGGNIGFSNAATLYLEGNTVVDGTNSRCHAGAQYGNNIGINKVGAKLYVRGNAVIKNGVNTFEGAEDYTRYSVSVIEGTSATSHATVYLDGNAQVDTIWLRGATKAAVDNTVVIQAGYAGSATVFTNYATYNNSVVPGADLYAAVVAEANYANTGKLRAMRNAETGYDAFYPDGKFVIAGYSGVNIVDGTPVEEGLMDLTTSANYDYVKVYVGGNVALYADVPVYLCGTSTVNFLANGHTLNAIDTNTDDGKDAKGSFTIDDATKLNLFVTDPATNKSYLCVQAEDGTYSSNNVQVELTKVSVRPEIECADHAGKTNAGVYYTAKIVANANAATYLTEYGVVAGLDTANTYEIEENFVDNTAGFRWTAVGLSTTAAINKQVRSGMIANVLCTGLTSSQNVTRGAYTIEAKAYVTANIGGKDVKILSNEASYSMQQLVEKLDEVYATLPAEEAATKGYIESFFSNYYDTMSQWTTPNLKAWYETNNAA